jgi:hypothetical protein
MSKNQAERVRRISLALPDTSEKLSHGEPTFFVHNKVFVMLANNHHDDGRIAAWLPVPPGMQPVLIDRSPATFFKPPYVGVRGWVGIDLPHINDDDLRFYIQTAWEQVAPKRLRAKVRASSAPPEHARKPRAVNRNRPKGRKRS